jgi:dihydroorotase-like cyclic amidohydrolase
LARLTFVDLHEKWKVDSETFCSKGHSTPFDGEQLISKIKRVLILP